MKLALRPYRHGDAAEIAPREDFRLQHLAEGEPLFKAPLTPLGLTVTREGIPIACGGATDHPDGLVTLWGYAGDLSPREWAFVRRGIETLLDLLRAGNRKEAQALVGFGAPIGHAHFLARIGFELRSVQRDEDGAYWWMVYKLKEA